MRQLSLAFTLLLVTASVPVSPVAGADTADTEPPLADAGLDQSVVPGTTVYLDGGGSLDPDGEIESYRWSIETPAGEAIAPKDQDAAMTRFVPRQPGRYLVELTVTDDDGNSQSDTLYVDVGGAVDTDPPADPAEPASDPSQTVPAQVVEAPMNVIERGPQNQEPFGRILGPGTVRSGSAARYLLETGDADGEVTSYRWLPASHTTGSSGIIDPQQSAQTYRFDVEPGTTVRLPAVVVDNDGASSTVRKTVTVTNNAPNAAIHGESTVAVGSVHEYEVVASDPDGPVTDYDWVTASSSVERVETGGLVSGGSEDGSRTALYRFTSIPEDDATVDVRATVEDEHGGSTTAEIGVTVVKDVQNGSARVPEDRLRPQISDLEARQNGRSDSLFGVQNAQPGRIVFTATATDNDSELLSFEWKFGDLGSATTVEQGDEMTSMVSFSFARNEVGNKEDISLTVTDQSGRSQTVSKTLRFTVNPGAKTAGYTLNANVKDNRLVRGSLIASGTDTEAPSSIYVYFGDGEKLQVKKMEKIDDNEPVYRFEHRYQTAGQFVIQAHYDHSFEQTTVSVGDETYTEWVYEEKVTDITQTVAAERPGQNWTRTGVNHVKHEQVGVLTERTQIVDGESFIPGSDWERVGTETEYHTEKQTKRAVESPGSEWELSKQNIDERTVFDGWETRTVPSKWMADSDWDYVGKVPRTTTTIETTESTTRPEGSGWERAGRTGDSEITGYSTEWVTNRYFVGDDWQYVGADRYVSGYSYSTICVDRVYFGYRSYCVEEETTRSPDYDTRYKYRVPSYSDVYEWERTVEKTTYDHEYRVETYSTETVHEYVKEVRIGTKYAQWEKPEYESTEVYTWKSTETSWKETTSLSQPTGDVRNVEKKVRECGEKPESQEPAICSGDQP